MANQEIVSIRGYELLDSRSNPTVAARVTLQDGSVGFAISPSGASTGAFEAYELRDGDKERFCGKGVLTAVRGINKEIEPLLIGEMSTEQRKIDEKMMALDGTKNKSRLGANAILAVSLAVADAAAKSQKIPLYRYIGNLFGNQRFELPVPMMNILNGGMHAQNNIDIQEFMIVPRQFSSFSEALRAASEIYHALGGLFKEKGLSCGVGDEGGFAPSLNNDEQALELICEAIISAGYNFEQIKIALDVASSEWYKSGRYFLPKRAIDKTNEQLIEYYKTLCGKYPIISLEDGAAEEDWEGWKALTKSLSPLQLVGDDLFVTNTSRLALGIEQNAANAILIKPNQIGTLTETLDVIKLAKQNGYKTIISHRSGESEDTAIADIAVGVLAGQIKTGAPCRSDRVAKYNRLLMIENELDK